MAELEARGGSAGGAQRPAADEAALREVALLRSRVHELEAACSAETLGAGAAAQQQAEAPCSPALDLDRASHAYALELESTAHGEVAALRRRVLELEAAHSSVQALEGAGPWCPASSDSSAAEAGPSMTLSQDGVQSDQVALCPCLQSNTACNACRVDRCGQRVVGINSQEHVLVTNSIERSLLSAWCQDELP